MIPIDTRPGTQVECIDDENYDLSVKMLLAVNSLPRKGRVYTVREIVKTERHHGVRLLEVQNPLLRFADGGHEPAFSLRRFRVAPSLAREKRY